VSVPVPLRVVEGYARAYRRTWKGTAATTFVSPVLFLAAMGLGLGALVDRGSATAVPAETYLAFLAPGLLAATAMQTAATDTTWPVMAGIKWLKTYHAALATPVSPRDLVAGHLGWVLLRVAFAAVVFAAVMVVFGATGPLGAALAVLPATLTGLAVASLVTAFTASRQNEYALASLHRFGIMPLYLFSGTFFPLDRVPEALHPVAYMSPLWHGVELTRAAALGGDPAWPAAVHVVLLVACALAGFPLAVRAFAERLTP
jgi:lipooligosaccharide transport system permease protein